MNEQDFWERVDRNGPVPETRPDLGPCWIWTRHINREGYGEFKKGRAHRFSYVLIIGAIPEGKELDHLCRVRRCVNPAHLEPVTRKTNILRGESFSAKNAAKTHCSKGHALTKENIKIRERKGVGTGRTCITCELERKRLWARQRRKRRKATKEPHQHEKSCWAVRFTKAGRRTYCLICGKVNRRAPATPTAPDCPDCWEYAHTTHGFMSMKCPKHRERRAPSEPVTGAKT